MFAELFAGVHFLLGVAICTIRVAELGGKYGLCFFFLERQAGCKRDEGRAVL